MDGRPALQPMWFSLAKQTLRPNSKHQSLLASLALVIQRLLVSFTDMRTAWFKSLIRSSYNDNTSIYSVLDILCDCETWTECHYVTSIAKPDSALMFSRQDTEATTVYSAQSQCLPSQTCIPPNFLMRHFEPFLQLDEIISSCLQLMYMKPRLAC